MKEDRRPSSPTLESNNMSQVYTRPAAILPLHDRPYSYDQPRADHYTPRGLNLDSSFVNLERRYEGEGRKNSSPKSSMSEENRRDTFDSRPSGMGDDYTKRSDVVQQKTPREQLPSLSTLFADARPILSAPNYPKGSPTYKAPSQEVRGAPIRPEQPSWDSMYQRAPTQPAPSHYSYISKPPPPPPPPPSDLLPPQRPKETQRPPSPRFHESRYIPQEAHRSQASTPSGRWSPRGDQYREYLPPPSRDTLTSFRSQQDHLQPYTSHAYRLESDARPQYGDAGRVSGAQYPLTPASTIGADSNTSKDGLGPKIWTGTQFLPRFVRQAEIPGEGLCYFYDDGTHCKTHIDGETVNAHWGVTKAGKPRKRLAIACITCREKKIKCDPDYPRCVQCEKFGRVCKFKNAPRGGHGSPETPPAEVEDLNQRLSLRAEQDSAKAEERQSENSASPQATRSPTSPDMNEPASKRRKTEVGGFTHVKFERIADAGLKVSTNGSARSPIAEGDLTTKHWSTDLMDIEEDLLHDLMNSFWVGIASTTYCMFPEKAFMKWLQDRSIEKSPDDLMLIYTMLALATVFSPRTDLIERGKEFAAISRYACDHQPFSLHLVQSRSLLAMYYYANDKPDDSWDLCGSALRVATGIKLNVELERTADDKTVYPFGLNWYGYAECRRRTFWACYIMDRFNGFCSGHVCIIHPEDVFLRLPCDIKSFEDQCEISNPYFDLSTPPIQNSRGTIGLMAYLVNICSIWADVMANIYRSSHSPYSPSFSIIENFSNTITNRLQAWQSSLPSSITYSRENLDIATEFGVQGTFITMHTLYHTAYLKLNRHVRPNSVPPTHLIQNIRLAHQHASKLLSITDDLASRSTRAPGPNSSHPISTPMVGYAASSAIDVLTAKGHLSSLPLPIQSAHRILGELNLYWHASQLQYRKVSARIEDLKSIQLEYSDSSGTSPGYHGNGWNATNAVSPSSHPGAKSQTAAKISRARGIFEFFKPLEHIVSESNDCIYGTDFEMWERALA